MLTKLSKKQFDKKLRSRKLEKIETVNAIEKILKTQRGYVFKMPPPGASVVLLLSGGLDSIVAWAILMKEFRLNVYPISFDIGERRAKRERASIEYFSRFYKKRFGDLFHFPERISLNIKKMVIPIEDPMKVLDPAEVFKNFRGPKKPEYVDITRGAFTLMPIYGKIYAEHLYQSKNIAIDTILCSVIPTDGLLIPFQTLTSLRSIMLNLTSTTRNLKWQFASVCFEKETGLYITKSDLIKWGYSEGIPLERTWSCWHSAKFQCGGSDCLTCYVRRQSFKKAGVPDKTIYMPVVKQNLPFIIKKTAKSVLSDVKTSFKFDT